MDCWENSELIFPLWRRYKMGTFGSNKQIIKNKIMRQKNFKVGKPSSIWEVKPTGPSPENSSTMKVGLQYLFLLTIWG